MGAREEATAANLGGVRVEVTGEAATEEATGEVHLAEWMEDATGAVHLAGWMEDATGAVNLAEEEAAATVAANLAV